MEESVHIKVEVDGDDFCDSEPPAKCPKMETFKCDFCDKWLVTEEALGRHVRIDHEPTGQFGCDQCGDSFLFQSSLQMHIQLDHMDKMSEFRCSKCDKNLSSKDSLLRHVLIVHEKRTSVKRSFKCDMCDLGFRKIESFEAHERAAHKVVCFAILASGQTCGQKFKDQMWLKRHTTARHGQGDFPFAVKHAIDHVEKSALTGKFPCTRCGDEFSSQNTLKMHFDLSHVASASHRCLECGKQFNKGSDLERHFQTVHEKIRYKCDRCPMTFGDKARVLSHIRKGHAAPIEDLAFVDPVSVKQEIIEHDELPKISCSAPNCPDKFIHQTSLDMHMRLVHDMSTNFQCDACDKNFESRRSLLRHFLSIHELQRYLCSQCNNSYTDRPQFINHLKKNHGISGLAKKDIDSAIISGIQPLPSETANATPGLAIEVKRDGDFVCNHCGERFQLQTSLTMHTNLRHGIKAKKKVDFACEICPGKSFLRRGDLVNHINLVHEKKMVSCEVCGLNFDDASMLDKHMKCSHVTKEPQHVTATKFRCDKCDETFLYEKSLTMHLNLTHDNSTNLTCLHCDAKLETKFTCNRHMLKIHENRRVSCEWCNKLFTDNVGLDKHLKTSHGMDSGSTVLEENSHSQQDPTLTNKCDLCDEVFSIKECLTMHISLLHQKCDVGNKNLNLKCLLCDRPEFPSRVTLVKHFTSVHERRRYKCDICSKIVFDKSSLVRHMQFVHEVKQHREEELPEIETEEDLKEGPPVKCNYCDETFRIPSCLKMHTDIAHSSKRTSKCRICAKNFSKPARLHNHIKTVHEKRRVRCEECGETLSSKTNLIIHLKNLHGIEITNAREFQCDIVDVGSAKKVVKPIPLPVQEEEEPEFEPLNETVDIFPCELCDEAFKIQECLAMHVQLCHHPIKTSCRIFDCMVCGRRFDARRKMIKHFMAVHENRKYQCQTCKKKFVNISNLEYHIKDHHQNQENPDPDPTMLSSGAGLDDVQVKCELTLEQEQLQEQTMPGPSDFLENNDGPEKCSWCEEVFKIPVCLKMHVDLYHKNKKIDTCLICGKVLSTKSTFNRHIKVVHEQIKIKCYLCPQYFNDNRNVARHIKSIHKIEVTTKEVAKILAQQSSQQLPSMSNPLVKVEIKEEAHSD